MRLSEAFGLSRVDIEQARKLTKDAFRISHKFDQSDEMARAAHLRALKAWQSILKAPKSAEEKREARKWVQAHTWKAELYGGGRSRGDDT